MGRTEAATDGVVLLALSGLSPAVLTESVWALARETPPVVPERVVVLTTRRGREAICRELLVSGVWERLRHCLGLPASTLRFGPAADSIRLFPAAAGMADADDIATPGDSARAGDFILENLRQFTENPGVRVVFSIAGGRKTMAALGAVAMTLLGRSGDRLCHVLVNPPFDNPALSPRFAFPDPAVPCHMLGDEPIPGVDARITLCDIPYVRTRHLFAEHLGALPGTFSTLVERANRCVESSPAVPRVLLDPSRSLCSANGIEIALSVSEYLLFWLFCERARRGEGRIIRCGQLVHEMRAFEPTVSCQRMPAKLHWRDSSFIEDEAAMRKLVHRLRTKLKASLGGSPCWPLVDPAPRRGEYGVDVSPAGIEIRERRQ